MPNPTPTGDIETDAELLRRAGLKNQIKRKATGGQPVSTVTLADDLPASRALLRQLATELVADGELVALPQRGSIPQRYRCGGVVVADD